MLTFQSLRMKYPYPYLVSDTSITHTDNCSDLGSWKRAVKEKLDSAIATGRTNSTTYAYKTNSSQYTPCFFFKNYDSEWINQYTQ